MALSTFNIGGIASGLDTNSIIAQLMQLERVPITRLEGRQTKLRTVDSAWGQVVTKLSSLRTAIDKLDRADDFTGYWKTTSSNTDVATATRTGTVGSPSSVTFTVGNLALAQQSSGTVAFATSDATLGGGTYFTVKDATGAVIGTVNTDANTTLSGLATSIDALEGVTASVVQVNTGDYRLVMGAEQTGTDAAFTVASDIAAFDRWANDFTTTAAENAAITTGGLTIYRQTNTVTDLIDGVSITLVKEDPAQVTISTARDVDKAVSTIKELVDGLNGLLTTIKSLSSYNADTKVGGALAGNPLARSISTELRNVIADTITSLTGTYTYAASVGIELTQEGGVTLDETALKDALTADFDGVVDLFRRSGSAADARLSYTTATDTTVPGSYAVTVTQAARVAAVTGATYSSPVTNPATFRITTDEGTVVEVTVAVGDNLQAAITKINNALTSEGVTTITASDDGGAIKLAETRYGSTTSFTVDHVSGDDATAFGLVGSYSGADVQGTINGQAATGDGQFLSSTAGDSKDLKVRVTATQAEVDGAAGSLSLGNIDYAAGLAGTLSRVAKKGEGAEGTIQTTRDGISDRISLYDQQIERIELRLAIREQTLRRQFTAMESMLAQLNSQGNWLSQQIAGLSALNSSQK